MDFEKKYAEYLILFERNLNDYLDNNLNGIPEVLRSAVRYAVLDGGKRIRPVLCLATAEMLGLDPMSVMNYAIAIEMIHSYSLVHDDLPAMDNDDFRRGKPSTHKKYGEAIGILAGDALLNLAAEVCLDRDGFDFNDAFATKIIFNFAGVNGMIGGQVLDLLNEKNSNGDEVTLFSIYENKTSKLLTAPILVSSVKAGKKYYNELETFGKYLGLLFQITDDILDVEGDLYSIGKTPHKDEEEEKFTSVKLFGIDGAKKFTSLFFKSCLDILYQIDGSDFLISLTEKIYNRKK